MVEPHGNPGGVTALTPEGALRPHIRVMTTGVFDLLHPGHLRMLEEAKKLGDELVVVIARDASAEKEKHRPITPEEHRRAMVEALKPVDRAVLGHLGDYYRIVTELRPDIVALGYDQKYAEADVEAECARRGHKCKVVRLPHVVSDLDGTRKIIERVAERAAEQSLYRKGPA
ncbi:MAG: synthetase [Thermoplasmata archaeon]|jgi:FAD synthetase|nr:synthetase [Thermoplasmata archaeon]